MNKIEQQMVEILKDLKENCGAISARAEFEAEGTKMEELLRLKEICMVAGLGLTLKIGGCESIRDMLEVRTVGVNYIVAPMVESAYAMRKYLQAVHKIFPQEELESIEILCNIETAAACKSLDAMLEVPEIGTLNGIVLERVDLCFSMGRSDQCINDDDINQMVLEAITKAKEKHLTCAIGGGVSADSLPFFERIPKGYLDRFETRKVCFRWQDTKNGNKEKAILKALGFEALWLRNKLTYYQGIASADAQRMNLIEQRYWKAISTLL